MTLILYVSDVNVEYGYSHEYLWSVGYAVNVSDNLMMENYFKALLLLFQRVCVLLWEKIS